MERELSKAEIQEQLQGRTASIERRIDSLEGEVSTLGESLQEALFDHPLVSIGGAAALGVLVGLLVGGRKRDEDVFGVGQAHQALVERYVDLLADDVRWAVEQGVEPEVALRQALHDRVPLIVYDQDASETSSGILRKLVGVFGGAAARIVTRLGAEFALGMLSPSKDGQAPASPEAAETSDAASSAVLHDE